MIADTHACWFYRTLRTLVLDGDVSDSHVLRRLPSDPFSKGQTKDERYAVAELERMCGIWSVKLRKLYYGYCQSGKRAQNLHTGITYMTMYDSDTRHLLRSHAEDSQIFPSVFFPDCEQEAAFRVKIRESDAIPHTLDRMSAHPDCTVKPDELKRERAVVDARERHRR